MSFSEKSKKPKIPSEYFWKSRKIPKNPENLKTEIRESPITPGTDLAWLVYFLQSKPLIKFPKNQSTSNADPEISYNPRKWLHMAGILPITPGSDFTWLVYFPITPGLYFSWLVYFYRANPPIKSGAFSTTSNADPKIGQKPPKSTPNRCDMGPCSKTFTWHGTL